MRYALMNLQKRKRKFLPAEHLEIMRHLNGNFVFFGIALLLTA
jgi:hypothetical protein